MKFRKEKASCFHKKFYRRTTILTWLMCATILNAVDEKLGNTHMLHTPQVADKHTIPHRPFAPHVHVLSGSEIQVSWLPVLLSNKQTVRYELFNGDDPEYVGYELVYVAKRLKPSSEYRFRVRACSASDCSEFSLARSCRTRHGAPHGRNVSWSRPLFGKRRILIVLLPPLAVITFLATLGICIVYFWRLLCYYLWQYSSVPFEPSVQRKGSLNYIKAQEMLSALELGGNELQPSHFEKTYIQLHPEHIDPIDKVTKDKDVTSTENGANLLGKDSETKSSSDKSPRIRASSLKNKKMKKAVESRQRSVSEGEKINHEQSNFSKNQEEKVFQPARLDAIVVIDNSNVFIGAREAACTSNPKLRPKHVKVRLQSLTQVLEKGKRVSRRFAGGSSPPANEHVWDIYRRLGYTVDLEERRGKDEQRVDEQLHLCIYKAIIEMPPQTLILASGDGSKGKSTGATSFPDCVLAAIEHGWNVEVHSWKHSLSAEWLRIAAKYKDTFKIQYLDENIHKITSIEYRNKSREKQEDGVIKQQNDQRISA